MQSKPDSFSRVKKEYFEKHYLEWDIHEVENWAKNLISSVSENILKKTISSLKSNEVGLRLSFDIILDGEILDELKKCKTEISVKSELKLLGVKDETVLRILSTEILKLGTTAEKKQFFISEPKDVESVFQLFELDFQSEWLTFFHRNGIPKEILKDKSKTLQFLRLLKAYEKNENFKSPLKIDSSPKEKQKISKILNKIVNFEEKEVKELLTKLEQSEFI